MEELKHQGEGGDVFAGATSTVVGVGAGGGEVKGHGQGHGAGATTTLCLSLELNMLRSTASAPGSLLNPNVCSGNAKDNAKGNVSANASLCSSSYVETLVVRITLTNEITGNRHATLAPHVKPNF